MQRLFVRLVVFALACVSTALAAPAHAQLLPAPTNVTATSISRQQINLSWSAVTGAVSYDIYRSTTSGGEVSVGSVNAPTTTYQNSGLIYSQPYFYQVAAVASSANGGMVGTLSAEQEAVTSPAGISAVGGDGVALIGWDTGPSGITYTVTRSSGGAFTSVATGLTGSPYTDATVVNQTSYNYEVTALANGKASYPSTYATTAPIPQLKIDQGSVSGLTASGQTSGGVIAWGADSSTAGSNVTTPQASFSNLPSGVPYQLFQSQRQSTGSGLSYSESNIANGSYTLTLYFAEINTNVTASGQRVFNVSINGAQALTNFDIYQTAGARFKVVAESFPVTVSSGQLSIVYQDVTTANRSLAAAFALSPSIPPAADIPAPGWGGDVLPSDDGTGAEGAGPGASLGVSLPSLVEEIQPGPDISAYNPLGPSVSYERIFRGNRAQTGYASPGLSAGWTDNYDLSIVSVINAQTMAITGYNLIYPNGAVDAWTLSGTTLTPPRGAPYVATMVNATTITMEFKNRSVYTFSQITKASANYALGTYLFSKITNLVGHSVTIDRDSAANNYRVLMIQNDATPTAKTLLNFVYPSVTLARVQDVASANSADHREVEYNFSGTPSLLQDVTTIQPYDAPFTTHNDQWQYLYQTIGGVNYVATVKGPDPQTFTLSSPTFVSASTTLGTTGAMMGLVQAFTDANSSMRSYQPRTDGTQVSVYTKNTDANPVQQWEQLALIGSATKNADGGIKDATGHSDTMAYTSPGGSYSPSPSPYLPSLSIDRNGHVVDLTYDTNNNYGNILTMTESGTVPGTTISRSTTTTLTYDPTFPLGQVKSEQESYTTTAANGATGNGEKTATSFDYYANGELKDVNSPEPGTVDENVQVTTTYSYTGLGDISSIIAPGNDLFPTITTSFKYATPEAVGEPQSVTDNANDVTQFKYDGRGNCTAVIDPSGNETDYAYNIANQLTTVTYPYTGDPAIANHTGAFVSYAYQYPGGPLTSASLYPENVAAMQGPDRQTTYSYDHEGQVVKIADLGGTVATYAYDGMGRVISVTDGGTSTIGGTSHTTKYAYNSDGSLSQVQYPHAAGTASGSFDTETYTYDADQNVMSKVDGQGVTTTYARSDPESLVSQVSYALPATPPADVVNIAPVSYVYDGFGRRSAMTDGTGTKSYAYDDLDSLNSVTVDFNLPGTSTPGPQNQTVGYSYNPDGTRSFLSSPLTLAHNTFQYSQQYEYDAAQRLTEVFFPWTNSPNPQIGVASYEYQLNGWLKATHLAYTDPGYDDIVDITPTFNKRGFITDLSAKYSDTMYYNEDTSDPLVGDFNTGGSTAYNAYDSSGNRKTAFATIPFQNNLNDQYPPIRGILFPASRNLTYGYDNRDELISDQGVVPNMGADNYYNIDHSYSFSYDSAYNPLTFRSTGPDAFTNDEQLSTFYSMTGVSLGTLAYDGNGDPSSYPFTTNNYPSAQPVQPNQYQTGSIQFDPENRVAAADGVSFTYDGDGQRATKTVAGVTTYFLYDEDEVLDEVQKTPSGYQVTTAYGWGADGLRTRYTPVAQGDYINADTSFGYLYDLSGNVSQRLEFYETAQNGLFVGARDYSVFDAFGLLTGHWDAVAVPYGTGTDLTSVGFGGQFGYYTDLETGLVLLGARYYDPSTGRFLNRDPIGYDGGINLYGFAGNNPVNESDPSGDGPAASPGSGSHHFGPKNTGKGINLKFSISEEQLEAIGLGLVEGIGTVQAEEGIITPEDEELEDVAVSSTSMNLALGSNTNCFVAGTLVEMADGTTKKIEDVRQGDWVLSRNPDTGVTEAKAVMSRSVKAAPQVLTLTLVDPKTHLTQSITCTPGHPFYVQGRGFVLAGDLGIGTSIVTRAGPCLSVSGIAWEPESAGGVPVYNFTVADDHTYFVGTLDGGTWVHNNSPAATPVLPNRTQAFNQAKDFAKIPRSQQPDEQWRTGDDASRASYPNYRLSSDPDTHGRYYQYNTPNGPRVIAEHLNDGPPHFHAGMPKDNATFSGFKNERYLKVPGQPKHIYYRTK